MLAVTTGATPERAWAVIGDVAALAETLATTMSDLLPPEPPEHKRLSAARTITNVDGATTATQATIVGKAPGTDGLRRFLVGPKECEITGIAESGDGRALFVNIQHPGEDTAPNYANPASFGSHWPDGGTARPRSATVVITRNDGGLIGL